MKYCNPVLITPEIIYFLQSNYCSEEYKNVKGDWLLNKTGNSVFVIDPKSITDSIYQAALYDLKISKHLIEARSLLTIPDEGDFLIRKDGSESRLTSVRDNWLQDGGGSESFFMSSSGTASYSGGCGDGLPTDKIALTNESRIGLFWFFSQNRTGANRSSHFTCNVKVWREIE